MFVGRVRVTWFLISAVSVFFASCTGGGGSGPPVVEVTGRLLENGQPVAVENFREGYNCLQVDFYPVDASGTLVNAPHAAAFPAADGDSRWAANGATGSPPASIAWPFGGSIGGRG